MAFRCRTSAGNSRIDYWASNGRWNTFVTHLDGEQWSPAVQMPSSDGRNSMFPAIALRGGNAYVAWPTDDRAWPGNKYGDLDVYAATLKVEGNAARSQRRPAHRGRARRRRQPASQRSRPTSSRSAAIASQFGGKSYRILRGDFHRHTELSGDGAGDGTLDDLYRYTLDAAADGFGTWAITRWATTRSTPGGSPRSRTISTTCPSASCRSTATSAASRIRTAIAT